MNDSIIEVRSLKKSYGSVEAVKDISFDVARGSLFSFLGPNGAGKSTTVDILCTLLSYDGGEASVDGLRVGRDDARIRRSIGVVFQETVLDRLLTVRENLTVRAAFYLSGRSDIRAAVARAAEAAGVTEFIDRPFGKLSGGQRRRADIARALVHTPKVLFLDEPTTGLDPQTRKTVWETVRSLRNETGMTVFLTTHYMEEAAASDYVVVIDHGEVAAAGTPDGLKAAYSRDSLRLFPAGAGGESVRTWLTARGTDFTEKGGVVTVPLSSTGEALPLLEALKGSYSDFEVVRGTMDDVFIQITGKEIRE